MPLDVYCPKLNLKSVTVQESDSKRTCCSQPNLAQLERHLSVIEEIAA